MFPTMDQATYQGGLVYPDVSGKNISAKALLHSEGFGNVSARRKALAVRRAVQVAECADVWNRFRSGQIHPALMLEAFKGGADEISDWMAPELHRLAPSIFNEAMTRSDFTNLTTYVLDRLMFENYAAFPKTYESVAKLHTNVRDFRGVERWQTDGLERPYAKVGEMSGFNRQTEKTGKYTYQVYKYESGAQISWEATVNDDMDQFGTVPQRLALGGIRTIEQFWLSLIAGAAGPNTSFYGTAIALATGGTLANIVNLSSYTTGTFTGQNNPPITILNLILAAGLFMNQSTAEGRPIDPNSDELVVVVGDGVLYQTIQHIINTDQIVTTVLGGTKASSSVMYDLAGQAKNWIRGRLRAVYAPELRNIVTSNLATSWWMFARPGAGRPAIELGFLSGYDSPQLYRKLPNTVRVSGGGTVDEFGDFETMATELKGLLVFGGTRMDPRMTMASNGTGS